MLPLKSKKPWLSADTVLLLRRLSRGHFDFEMEKQLNSEIKNSVKLDRAKWLDCMSRSGDRSAIKAIHLNKGCRQGRPRGTASNIVESCTRAETLAEHFA